MLRLSPTLLRTASPLAAILASALAAGCGVTKSQQATEQLLLSDAVDRVVADLDFRALAGETVYFDTRHLANVKHPAGSVVNVDYVIGSVRQQLAAAGCLLQERPEEADYVVEARLGALGADNHDVTYGVPANNVLSAATNLLPQAPAAPVLPELALARRNDQVGAAKLAVFAYHRETREPVWQSGVATARSEASALWVLGVGPWQRGTIHHAPQFAGDEVELPWGEEGEPAPRTPEGLASYFEEARFAPRPAEAPPAETRGGEVGLAGYDEPVR